MKTKIKNVLYGVSSAVIVLPVTVLAYEPPASTDLPTGSIYDIIQSLMKWLLGLVGFFGVIGFAIAGILYLTAAGDEGRIDMAKRAMVWSIVGVVVALLGVVIIQAADTLLGGKSAEF